MLGLIGKKIGMSQVFDENGVLTPVTVIKIEENVVVAERNIEKNGYEACVMGAVDAKPKRTKKPYAGQFKEGITPKKFLFEIRGFEAEYKVGDKFGIELFESVSSVDVQGTSKGKGYQGVMKRHNFKGGRATHGSKFHRGLGSTGQAAAPSRVFKGTKMPGRMGGATTTVKNLSVVKVDQEKQVLLLRGGVPGPKNGYVLVKTDRE